MHPVGPLHSDLAIEDIANRLASMCTQTPNDLAAYFLTADEVVTFQDTRATARCHVLRCDGNGVPRMNGLASLLGRKVVDYAMPRRDIEAAAEAFRATGSTSGFVGLAKKARGLFTHIKNTGEGGELLLYLLAEAYLGLPQVISKMHLKTSPQMHYHGVDGVHASVDPATSLLALWWGESKLYASLAAGISACLDSIAEYLVPDAPDGSPVERDIDLLYAYADITDPALFEAFKKYLNPDNPHFNKIQYRGLCLVGFDIADYPKADSEDPVMFSEQIKQSFQLWKETTRTAICAHQLHSTVLEVFLIPFPSVAGLRSSFLQALGIPE